MATASVRFAARMASETPVKFQKIKTRHVQN
jgi:hypothetical protein